MNPDNPPAYSETPSNNYKPLVNETCTPCHDMPQNPYGQPMHNIYMPQNAQPAPFPYGNMPQPSSQFMFATVQQPVPMVQPASTTVNVNTGPVEKRYCCSCCCTCFWIIVIIFVIGGIIQAATH